jgi:uncharacterized protein (DUF1778 family)
MDCLDQLNGEAYARCRVERANPRRVLPEKETAMAATSARIVLSVRDSKRVLKLLENPPKPTPALMAAARRRATRKK